MLLPLFARIEASPIGSAIRDSTWLFPAIESMHLIGLAVLGGAVLAVDLRLLRLGLRSQPLGVLGRDMQPWLTAGLAVMLPTGALLFCSEAVRCYGNTAFRVKMVSLVLAVAFTFTVRRRVIAAGESQSTALRALVAATSLLLWSAVGWAGRWIGFS